MNTNLHRAPKVYRDFGDAESCDLRASKMQAGVIENFDAASDAIALSFQPDLT
jgi:hypothetical protein